MSNLENKEFLGGLLIKNAAKGEIEAIVASLGVVDRDEDVILADAIKNASPVSMSSYGHDVVFGDAPVGRGELYVESDKAVFRGKMFLATQRGRETFEVLKEMGNFQQWSFAFRITGSEAPDEAWRKKGARRVLTKLDCFEVSPVIIGAGVGTRTLSAKQSRATAEDPFSKHGTTVQAIAKRYGYAPRPVTQRDFETRHAAWVCDTTEITEAQRKEARYWSNLACDVMGESRVTIVWDVDDLKTAGFFRPSEPDRIYLNPLLSVQQISATCIHECIHRKRFLRGLPNTERLVELDELELREVLGAA